MEPRSLLSRLLEAAITIVIIAFLINLAIKLIAEVWTAILAAAVISCAAIIAWRIWKHKRDAGKW